MSNLKEGKVYTQDFIQAVWSQFHNDPHSVVWSDDDGETWNEVPSMDTGKWRMSTDKEDGTRAHWIFKIR